MWRQRCGPGPVPLIWVGWGCGVVTSGEGSGAWHEVQHPEQGGLLRRRYFLFFPHKGPPEGIGGRIR